MGTLKLFIGVIPECFVKCYCYQTVGDYYLYWMEVSTGNRNMRKDEVCRYTVKSVLLSLGDDDIGGQKAACFSECDL